MTAVAATEDHARRWAERARLDLEAAADRGESGLSKIRTAISERHDEALGYRSLGDYLRTEYADALGNVCRVFGVEFRRQVVAELTEAGLSTRAIAPVVGVSKSQVATDVQVSSSGHVNTETGEVSDDYYDGYDLPDGVHSVGPGNAGERSCECGERMSWPEDTTDVDKATMLRLWAEHEAACPESSPSDDVTGGEVTSGEGVAPPADPEAATGGERVKSGGVSSSTPPTAPRPPVVGTDGKTYQPPAPKAPKRAPLIDSFTKKRWEMQKALESLSRLTTDDRFPQNAEKVATANRSDLLRIKDQLQLVIDALPEI